MSETSDIDPEAARAALIARRQELLRLAESSAEARQPVELDQTRVGRLSRMDALQSQAMSVETDRRRKVELQRIADWAASKTATMATASVAARRSPPSAWR
jgi:DnaK suppressor protein